MKLSNDCSLEFPEWCGHYTCLKTWRVNQVMVYYWCIPGCMDLFGSWEQECGQIARRKNSSQIVWSWTGWPSLESKKRPSKGQNDQLGVFVWGFSPRESLRCQWDSSGRESVMLFSLPSQFSICCLRNPRGSTSLIAVNLQQSSHKWLENRKIENPLTHPGNTSDSRSGIRGGGFNQLLEHWFKPKPVRQDPPLRHCLRYNMWSN